jgi:hypothetical protein
LVENKTSYAKTKDSHQGRHQDHGREYISDNTPLEHKSYPSDQQKKDGKKLIKPLLLSVLLHIRGGAFLQEKLGYPHYRIEVKKDAE